MKSKSSADSTGASGKRIASALHPAATLSGPDDPLDKTFAENDPTSPSSAMRSEAPVATGKEQGGGKEAPEADAAALGQTGRAAETDSLRIDTPETTDRGPVPFPTTENHPKTREEAIRDIAHRRFEERGAGTGASSRIGSTPKPNSIPVRRDSLRIERTAGRRTFRTSLSKVTTA